MSRTKLTLYQHTWKARDYDPDGAAYGTQAEADAAEAASARGLLGIEDDDFSAEDIAEALTDHTSADDIDDARIHAIREGAPLTDAEAIMAAEGLKNYESAIYPITVELDTVDLLRAIGGAGGGAFMVSAGALLEAGVVSARGVVAAWESGDLAGAVNGLDGWADDVEAAFPGLDFEAEGDDADDEAEPVNVADIKPGDMVDLEGAPGCTGDSFVGAEFEYARVTWVERETADCVRLDFVEFPSVGFDSSVSLPTIRGAEGDAERYTEQPFNKES